MSHRRTVGIVVFALVVAAVAGVAGTASAQSGAIPIDSCRTIADDGRYVLTSDIENSTRKVCIQILSSDVVFNGQGHTIDSGNTTESVGIKVNNSLTTISNVTIRNVSTTGWTAGIFYLDATNGTIENVNASENRRHGILLRAASDTRLRNVTAVGNGRWSLYLFGNTTNVTGRNVEIGSATVSFTASDVALTGIGSPGSPPNRTTIGQYVGAASTSQNASLRLAVNYTRQNITSSDVIEQTLRIWAYDGTWDKPSGVNFVNVERNRVVANVQGLQNASVFAPAGRTPTPTPTPTATPEPTDTETSTATETSSGDGPGFGIALALVALLTASFLVLRRD